MAKAETLLGGYAVTTDMVLEVMPVANGSGWQRKLILRHIIPTGKLPIKYQLEVLL
jgi:hypothetical protein